MSIKLGMISLGCAKNLVDGEHMLAQLADAGVTIVDDVAEADLAFSIICICDNDAVARDAGC